ncbi:DegV family protein [Anaerorhabdus sp.]|uniref:DegV family protein n=1 Tax=Anaerorhabdus sp. TaxID=1872524 RepID=UPI002FC5BB8A
MKNEINGQELYQLFKSGVNEIEKNKDLLNRINVFPVADGDTGSNLLYTLQSAVIYSENSNSAIDTLKSISDNAITYARGNSGIIFSEFIHGLSFYNQAEEIDVSNFIKMVNHSSDRLYEVVKNPIEGTVLTVIRKWSSYIESLNVSSFNDLFDLSLPILKQGVHETTKELKDLQKHKVPDSGAMGFYLLIEGFSHYINGTYETSTSDWKKFEEFELHEDFHDEKYQYCTQFFIKDIQGDLSNLIQELEMYGDSIAYSGDTKFLNLHMHTDQPWMISKLLYGKGNIVNSKVDDMKIQNKHRDHKEKIGIVTDSIADISQEVMDEYDIGLISMNLLMDNNVYLDKKTIQVDDFLKFVQNSKEFPSSSQPNDQQIKYEIGHFLDYYEKLILITVSKQLSGTHQGFLKVIENNPEFKGRVILVDSYLNSGGQGLFVKKVAELARASTSFEDLIQQIYIMRSRIEIYVALNNFENLSRSGRINTRIATFANQLKMKAILSLDKQGKGKAYGFSLRAKSLEKKIFKEIKKALKRGPIEEYVLVYSNESNAFQDFRNKVEALLNKAPSYCIPISSATALHVGKDSIAIAFVGVE